MAYESLPKQGNSIVTDSSVLVTQNFAAQIDHSDDETNRFDPIKTEGNVSVSANVPFSTYGEYKGKMNAPAVDQHNYMYYGYGVGSGDGITVVAATHMDITSGGVLYQDCGKIYVYDDDSGSLLWEKENPQPSAYANFGTAIAVGGGRIVVSCHRDKNGTTEYQGTAYVFDYNGNQLARLEADATDATNDPDLNFGERVAIGNSYIAIASDRCRASANLDGSNNALSNDLGVIYFYDKNTLQFVEKKFIPASEWTGGTANFGSQIAFGDGKFVASAYSWTYPSGHTTYTKTGGAFIYDENTLQFEYSCRLPADEIDQNYLNLGNWALDIAGGKIFIECQTDDSFQNNSGAVFVFNLQGEFVAKIKSPNPTNGEYFGKIFAANSKFLAVLSPSKSNYGGSSGELFFYDTTTLEHVLTIEKDVWGNNGSSWSSTAFTFGSNGFFYAGNANAIDLNTNITAGHVIKWDMSGSLLAPPFEFSYIKSLRAEAESGSGDSFSTSDYFGKATAIGGDKLFVSAPRANYNSTTGGDIGAVYVFDLDGNYLSKLESSVPENNMHFGSGMAAGDGIVAIASDGADLNGGGNSGGYWDAGRLDIFNLSDLSHVASVQPPVTSNYCGFARLDNHGFYQQMSIHQTVAVGHNLIVVGAPMEDNASGTNLYGAVYVFDTAGNYQFKISSPDGDRNAFGGSVAIGENRIIVGAPYGSNCKVYWFDLSGNHLFTHGSGTSGISEGNVYGDQYGFALRIYEGVLYVSVPGGDLQTTNAGQMEKWSIANQSYLGKIQPAFYYGSYEYFGASFDVGEGYLIAGLPGEDDNTSNCGAIVGFYADGSPLTEQMFNPSVSATSATENNEYYGDSSIVIGDGRILASAWRRSSKTGDCYLYRTSGVPFNATLLDGNSYLKSTVDPANSTAVVKKSVYAEGPSNWYGRTLVANSSRVVVGAERFNNYKGKVYIYDLDMNEITTLQCPDEVSNDGQIYFGASLAISDTHIAVAAPNKHVNGNNQSGAVYLYDLDGNYVRTFLPLADDGTNESRAGSYWGRGGQGIALTNDLLVVGTRNWPLNGSNNAGKAWLYNIDGTIVKSLVGDGTEDWVVEGGDYFGEYVAINEGKILVACAYGQLNSNYNNAAGFVAVFDYNGDYIGRLADPESGGSNNFARGHIEIKNGFIYVPATYYQYGGTTGYGRYYIFDTDLNYIRYVTQFGPLIAGNYGFKGIAVGSDKLYLGNYYAADRNGVIYVYTLDGGPLYTISNSAEDEYLGWGRSFAEVGDNLYAGAYQNNTSGSYAGAVYKYGPGEAELNFESNDFSVEIMYDQANNTQSTPQNTFHMLGSSDPVDNGWSLKLNHIAQSTAPQHIVSVGSTQAAADQYFGASVGVGTEVIVVGEPYAENNSSPDNSGELHVYDTQGNILYNVNNLSGAEANENLGGSVKVRDGLIIATATGHQGDEGKVYILEESTTNQGVSATLKPTDLSPGDRFGSDAGAADNLIVVGTRSTSSEGRAYVFDRTGTLQTTIEPTDAGAGSLYMNGSDRLEVEHPAAQEFNFGSGDFTIEAWVNRDRPYNHAICSLWGGSGKRSFAFHVLSDNSLVLRLSTGNSYTTISTPTNTILEDIWYHVAAVRNGDDVTLYVDGVASANATYTGALDVVTDQYTPFRIGYSAGYHQYGYLSNLRIVKGEALYTSNFTPPTDQLNLTGGSDGSVAFDGTGDFLSTPSSSELQFAGGDFTVEGWVYLNTLGLNQVIVQKWGGVGSREFIFRVGTDNLLRFVYNNGVDSLSVPADPNTELSSNTWHHVALTRSGNSLKMYVDGAIVGATSSFSATLPSTSQDVTIGDSLYGNVSNVRLIKGTALYNLGNSYTVPTQPLSGNIEAQTGSVRIQGSTIAGLNIPNDADFNFGGDDFTIEMWVKFDTIYNAYLLTKAATNFSLGTFEFNSGVNTTTKVVWFTINQGGSNVSISGTTALQTDTWYHIAFTRNGNDLKIFLDGSEDASGTVTQPIQIPTNAKNIIVGNGDFNGYISNLRIVKGTALYTSNFTVPTQQLTNITGTSLLCCQSSTDPLQEATDKTIGYYFGNSSLVNASTESPGLPTGENLVKLLCCNDLTDITAEATGKTIAVNGDATTSHIIPFVVDIDPSQSTTILLAAQTAANMTYERTGKTFTVVSGVQKSSLNPGFSVVDQFGYSVDVGSNFIAVGSPKHLFNTGAVYIYDYTGQQKAKIQQSGSLNFGQSVRIVSDGVICGTSNAGISKYNFSGNLIWTYNPTQLDGLGGQLDADDDYVISGQPLFNPSNKIYSGAATVLLSSDGSLVSQLQPQTSATGQNYGIDTAFGSGRFVVGASRADSGSVSYAGNVEISSPTYDVARKATFAYNYENPDFEGAVYFDGVDDKLTFHPQGDEFALGDEEWTVEFWMKLVEDVPVTNYGLVIFSNLEWEDDPQNSYYYSIKRGGIRFAAYRDGSLNKIRAYIYTENRSSYDTVTSSSNLPLEVGRWYHICYSHSDYVTSSGEIRKLQNLFINGEQNSYGTVGPGRMGKPDTEPVERFVIGGEEAGNPYGWSHFKGYISNFRFVRGKVMYNKDLLTQDYPGQNLSSSVNRDFIPPNKALQNVDGTILLACYHPTNFTKELTGTTVSFDGSPTATIDSPKLKAGALEFDGVSQSMGLAAGNIFEYGTGDFTIEFWVNSSDNTVSGSQSRTIVGYDASDNQGDVYLEVGTGKVVFGNTTSPYLHTKSTSSVTDGYWHHVAISRSNGNVSIFIDGIKEVTTTNAIDYQAPSGGVQYLPGAPAGNVTSNLNDIGDYAYTDPVKGSWRQASNKGHVAEGDMTWEAANNRWKITYGTKLSNSYFVYTAFATTPGVSYTLRIRTQPWNGSVVMQYGMLDPTDTYSDGFPTSYGYIGHSFAMYDDTSWSSSSAQEFTFTAIGNAGYVALKTNQGYGYLYLYEFSISETVPAAVVGASSSGGGFFSGKLSNLHIDKKTAKYTVDFTPPTRNIERSAGSSLIMANDSTDATTEKSGKEVIRNGALYPGDFASSFKYNNSGQYTGYNTLFSLSNEHFQWEAWVKFTEAAKYNNYFRCIFTGNRAASMTSSGNFIVYVADGSVAGQPAGSVVFQNGSMMGVTPVINDGNWHHIAATRGDGDPNNYKFYSDGVLVDEGNISGNGNSSNPQLQWGIAYYSYSRFIGSIADSRLIKGGYIYSGNFTPPTAPLDIVSEVPSGQSSTTVETVALLNSPISVNSLSTNTGEVYLSTYSTVTIETDSPYSASAPPVTKFNGGHLAMVDPKVKDFMNNGGKEDFYMEFWINPQSHKHGDFFKSPFISHSNPNGSNTRSSFAWDYRGNGVYNDPGGYGIYTTNISGYMDGNNTSASGDATQVFGASMSNSFASYNGRGIYFNPIPIYKGQKVELYVDDNNQGNYGSRIWLNQTINTNEYGGSNVWVDLTPTIDNEISDPMTPFNLHSLGWNAPSGSYSGSYRYIKGLRIDGVEIYSNYPVGEFPAEFIDGTFTQTTPVSEHWSIGPDGTGTPTIAWWDGTTERIFKADSTIPAGSWTHLALDRMNTNTLRWFINGKWAGNTNHGSYLSPTFDDSLPLMIGRSVGGTLDATVTNFRLQVGENAEDIHGLSWSQLYNDGFTPSYTTTITDNTLVSLFTTNDATFEGTGKAVGGNAAVTDGPETIGITVPLTEHDTGYHTITTILPESEQEWHHLVVAKEDGEIAFIYDGNVASITQELAPHVIRYSPTGNVYIGGNPDGEGFIGNVGAIRVSQGESLFQTALTATSSNVFVKVAGEWKRAKEVYVKIGGAWRRLDNDIIWARANGQYEQWYSPAE